MSTSTYDSSDDRPGIDGVTDHLQAAEHLLRELWSDAIAEQRPVDDLVAAHRAVHQALLTVRAHHGPLRSHSHVGRALPRSPERQRTVGHHPVPDGRD